MTVNVFRVAEVSALKIAVRMDVPRAVDSALRRDTFSL